MENSELMYLSRSLHAVCRSPLTGTAAPASTHRGPRGFPGTVARAAGSGLLGVALGAAGCGGHDQKVTLPSRPATGAATRSSPVATPSVSAQTPQAAVIAAYTGFLGAAKRAILAPAGQARPILADYATGAYLTFQVSQASAHQAAHEEPWGKPVTHITKVDVTAAAATVHDCQDDSGDGLADARTHQLIPQTLGTANENLVANLTLGGDGRWRVASLRMYRAACQVP